MSERCELEELLPQPALVMKFRAAAAGLPHRFFDRYASIIGYLHHLGRAPASPPFAIYGNIDANAVDVEAGFAIAADVAGEGHLIRSALPGGQVATLIHVGDYVHIDASYDKLLTWMEQRGLKRIGPFMESYLNSPINTPSVEIRTKIFCRSRLESAVSPGVTLACGPSGGVRAPAAEPDRAR